MSSPAVIVDPNRTVLMSDEWLEWNRRTWGVGAVRVGYAPQGKNLPRLDGVLYTDRSGRVRMPPLNAYLPFVFRPTNTERRDRLAAQWLDVTTLLAADIRRRGLVGTIALPPGILDARAFQWSGLQVQLRYTFVTTLPIDPSHVDSSVRKRERKSRTSGYQVARSCDWNAIMDCLRRTETAKSFRHRIGVDALVSAAELLGPDRCRGYAVTDRAGATVSGGVRLHTPGGIALDWVQGTRRDSLKDGVNQQLYAYVLDDLSQAGATAFDYGGANIRAVAAAKATWGFPIVPYVAVTAADARHIARTALSAGDWATRRLRRSR